MNIVKRLLSGLVASVYVLLSVLVIPPPQVTAQSTSQLEKEYRAFVAWGAMQACVDRTGFKKADLAEATWASNNRKVYLGPAFYKGESKELDCNTPADMEVIVKELGFSSLRSFNEQIAKCEGDTCLFDSQWRSISASRAERGPDNALSSLSEAAQYWYWQTIYRLQGNTMCGGYLSKDRSRYDQNKDDNKADADGPYYYVNETEKKVDEYPYAIYGASVNRTIDNVALNPSNAIESVVTRVGGTTLPSDNTSNCREMSSKLKNKRLADAALAYVTATGSSVGISTESSEAEVGAKTCEEQFGISVGWLVCGMLELISNGVDAVFGYADALLNIDSQAFYNNTGLRTSWSYFRAIATFLLVAVGLVIIIGQAIGGGS